MKFRIIFVKNVCLFFFWRFFPLFSFTWVHIFMLKYIFLLLLKSLVDVQMGGGRGRGEHSKIMKKKTEKETNYVLRGLASQWTRRRLLLFKTIPLLVNLRGFRNSVIWDWRKALLGGLLGRLDGRLDGRLLGEASQGVQVNRPLGSGSSRTKSKFQRFESASWWRCNSLATNWVCWSASCGLRGPKRQRLTRDRHGSLGLTRDSPAPPPIIMALTSREIGAAMRTRVVILISRLTDDGGNVLWGALHTAQTHTHTRTHTHTGRGQGWRGK